MHRTAKMILFKRPSEEAKQAITRILQKYYFSASEYNGETVFKRSNCGPGVPVSQYLKLTYTPVGIHLEAWLGKDGDAEEFPLTDHSVGSAGIVLNIIVEEIMSAA